MLLSCLLVADGLYCNASLVLVQALAEKESDGMAKMIYRKDTGEILGVHIFGLHAADLIHEASNAMATHQRVQVHMHRAYLCSVQQYPQTCMWQLAILQWCAIKLNGTPSVVVCLLGTNLLLCCTC